MEPSLADVKSEYNRFFGCDQDNYTIHCYQEFVNVTARTKVKELKMVYPCLGLAGEMGEVIEHVKKIVRDKDGVVSEEDRLRLQDELGDVLWYVVRLAKDCGTTLVDIMESNVEKLTKRAEFGKQ